MMIKQKPYKVDKAAFYKSKDIYNKFYDDGTCALLVSVGQRYHETSKF
jgi:hypothetical protein